MVNDSVFTGFQCLLLNGTKWVQSAKWAHPLAMPLADSNSALEGPTKLVEF